MPFYEVIYETGNRSVMEAPDDETALAGIKDHHQRATKGEVGRGASTERTDLSPGEAGYNPQVMDYPAERVARVLVYEKHPGDYGQDQTVSKEVFEEQLKAYVADKDVINVMEFSAFARDLSDPHAMPEGMHDSQFKMEEARELDLSNLDAADTEE